MIKSNIKFQEADEFSIHNSDDLKQIRAIISNNEMSNFVHSDSNHSYSEKMSIVGKCIWTIHIIIVVAILVLLMGTFCLVALLAKYTPIGRLVARYERPNASRISRE